MEMSVTDMLPLFTSEIVAKYSDHTKFRSFGRSLFTEVATASKLASIISQRGMKLIAADVERGQRGNLVVFDKMTQKNILPPFFNPYINLTELESYDYLYVEGTGPASVAWGRFLDEVAQRLEYLMNMIDGAYEKQCWDLLITGIVTLNNGDALSYGRKAGSLVDAGAGNYWDSAGVDPYTGTFTRGATWLRQTGKMAGNTINIVFNTATWALYQANPAVAARKLDVNNNMEVLTNKALINSTGAIFKGFTTVGAFNYVFWLYDEFFEDDNGTKFNFTNDKKIVMIPDTLPATLTYTAVPQRIKPGTSLTKSKFTVWTAVDEFADAEFTGVKSAGIPILAGIDQVYTEQVDA